MAALLFKQKHRAVRGIGTRQCGARFGNIHADFLK
jgi:hypothetical protein